jgi:hypothetical protein
MPRLSVGEFSIHLHGREFLFRPSFSALDKIGSPQDITDAFIKAQLANPENPSLYDIINAIDVLASCYVGDNDVHELIGFTRDSKNGLPKFHYKHIPANDLIVLAKKLMIDGVYGKPKRKAEKSKTDDEGADFNPLEFVSFAAKYFNMSMSEAWNLTMIEYQSRYAMEFPEEKPEGMTKDKFKALQEKLALKKAGK